MVVLLPATRTDAKPAIPAVATAIGLLAALVAFLGLIRWPLAVPSLARIPTDPLLVVGSLGLVGPREYR